MTTDDPAAFCFSCARSDLSEAIQLPAYNPWPQLIRPSRRTFLRCQPLVRLVYTPHPLWHLLEMPEPAEGTKTPTPQERNTFADRFTTVHEYMHFLVLDRTPAKELAKAHLAYAYDSIGLLTRSSKAGDRQIEAAWRGFKAINARLGDTGAKIGFAEELLATALAIAIMDQDTARGGKHRRFRDVFRRHRARMLADHEESLPGFKNAYTQIAPLAALMAGNTRLFNRLLPLLQPVRYANGDLHAIDALTHLLHLVKELGAIESIEEAEQLLTGLHEQLDPDWKLAVELQKENAREPEIRDGDQRFLYGRMANLLSHLSRGDLLYDQLSAAEPPDELPIHVGPAGVVLLHPMTARRRTIYAQAVVFARDTGESDGLANEYRSIAHFEGMRQQLAAGRGIVCPDNLTGTKRCQCSPGIRRAVHALGTLAVNGYFGTGEWERPACRA